MDEIETRKWVRGEQTDWESEQDEIQDKLSISNYILHKFHFAEVLTTLDLRNGFFHVEVFENYRKCISFVIHEV